MLRVAFNATPLLAPLTGIGNYIVQLAAALAASGEVDAHSFYGYRWRHEPPSVPAGIRPWVQRLRDNVKPFIPFRRELVERAQQLIFARGLRRQAIELYHEPNYVPLRYDVPVVISIHDLSWLNYPEMHPADRVRWLERGLPRAVERAAAILVDSEFIRHEVVTAFQVAPWRVHTAHLGVSAAFRPRNAVETASTLRQLGLVHGAYLLTVGTIEPRKNVGHALAAYARLPAALRDRYPLVVAGAKGWRAADLEEELRVLAGQGRIRFLGRVESSDLPAIYAGAAAFIFPSLYEGFGLPPLEAMASGVPVLASNRASLPEVMAEAGLMIDPQRPEDTAAKIEAILDDASARTGLARRGLNRAAGFTWEACARATLDAYRKAL